MARPIEKRSDIVDGVVRVIARQGLHATTISDIATEAGVSPGLLYRYWKGRDDLAEEAYRTHLLALVQRLAAITSAEPDVVGKLKLAIQAFLAFADEQPTLLKFLLLSQYDLSMAVPAEHGAFALVERLIADAIAQGRMRPIGQSFAAQLFMGIVLQPVVGAIYGKLPGPVAEHFDAIWQAVERALLEPERKPAARRRTA